MANDLAKLAARIAALERRLTQQTRTSRLAYSSLENGALDVYDEDGSLRAVIGQQPDGTTGVNIVNGPPPSQPTAPIVASVLGGITVSWDGGFTDGSTVPLDWARLEIHASTDATYDPSPATLQATMETAQGATVVVPCDTDVYVRTLARNTSGAASAPTVTVGPYGPAPVIADDVLDGIVTTVKLADDAVTDAKVAVAAIDSAALADNAVTAGKIAAGQILARHLTVGSVQADALAASSVSADKIAANSVTTGKIAALAVTADQLAANSVTAAKIAVGSIDATHIKAGAITTDKLDANAINGKVITGATVQTATSGARIVLNASNLTGYGTGGSKIGIEPNSTYPYIYWSSSDGTNKAVANVSGGSADANLGFNSGTFVDSADSVTYKWRTWFGNDFWVAERINASTSAPNGGRLYLGKSTAQLSAGPSGTMTLTAEAGIRAAGTFRADNISVGTVSISPVAGTPTSVTLSGGSIRGTSFRGFVTPITSLPGTQVLGVSCNNVSSAGMTIWLTRTNTTTTGVYWMIIGED
ncbi:hypothetical protein ACWGKQ_13585 [Streptomyces sp. NPDC054770]